MKKRVGAMLFIFLVSIVLSASAQLTTGTILGSVQDSSGAVIPGAKVTVLNEDTGISRVVQSDSAGRYNAPALGLGNYRVTATQDGFQTEVRSGIVLTVGREAVVNFQLTLGAVSQTVEVTGEAPLVNTTGGSLGEVVESHTIKELPLNGRDLTGLITLESGATDYTAPGSSDTGSGKLLVISGQRPTSNVFLIDGIPIESYSDKTPTGASGSFLGVDAVREFKVETNAYSAEFGRGSGGIFNMATQNGTNTFHGSVFEFLRNDKLDAAKWEDNKFGNEKPSFKRNQFGGSLGGPIVKDHTFFFGTYEGFRERLGNTITTTTLGDSLRQGFIPNASCVTTTATPIAPSVVPYLALYPKPTGATHCDGTADYSFDFTQPTNEDTFQVRIDHTLGSKDTLFGRYTYLNSNRDTLATNPGLPGYLIPVTIRNQYAALGENRIFSANLLNSFRFGFTRTLPVDGAKETAKVDPSLYWVPTVPQLGTLTVTGLGTVGNGIVGDARNVNSFQFLDDMTWTKGRNQFKWGFYFDRVQFNGWNPARDAGNYTFGSISQFFGATPRQFRGSISNGFNDAFRSFRQSIFGLYFQDDIKITSRFTVNAGLRYEFVTIPKENHGRVGNLRGDLNFILSPTTSADQITLGNPWIDNPSLHNFAPRVGFAWDLFGDGKTSIRGGFGIFFQQVDQSWMRTSGFRMPPFLVEQQASSNIPWPNIYSLCANDNPIHPQVAACSSVRPTPDFVQYNTRTPYAEQYNLSIQRQFGSHFVASLGYVGTGGVDLPGVANLDVPQGQSINGRLFFPTTLTPPNPNFNQIRYRYAFASSRYNSLQFSMTEKISEGLQFRASYTWSKNIDIISGSQTASDTGAGPNWVPYYYQPSLYRGLSSFDARHMFTMNSTYDLPFGKGKKFGGGMGRIGNAVIGGWELGGIISIATGFPGTVNISPPLSSLGFQVQFPDLAPGASNNPIRPGNTDQYYDPAAFAFPGRFLGNLGKNTLTLPGRANVDFTIHKNANITEALKVQVRFEAFNLFNHPDFGVPGLTVFDNTGKLQSTAGQITTTALSSRQVQVAVKLLF